MNNIRWYQAFMRLLCALVAVPGFAQQEQNRLDSLDTIKIEKLTGVKGKLDAAENVFKVSVFILLHYWGTGSVSDLAKAIKTALNIQGQS